MTFPTFTLLPYFSSLQPTSTVPVSRTANSLTEPDRDRSPVQLIRPPPSSRLHRPENFIIIVSDSTTTTQYDTAITDELPLGLGRGRAVATPRRDRYTHDRAGSNPVGDFFDAVEAGTGLSTHSIVVVARRCLDRVARGRTLKGTTGGR